MDLTLELQSKQLLRKFYTLNNYNSKSITPLKDFVLSNLIQAKTP